MTSATAHALLAASPRVAQALVTVFVVATGVLLARARRLPTAPDGAPLGGVRERVLLGLVLAGAVLTRVLWWHTGLTAPYWFSETTPLYVAKALGEGGLWAQWTPLLTKYQVAWTHESATVAPVAVLFQLAFGPSFHLPVLVGAFYGVAAVLLAWALGRAAHSSTFGLVFASLVAASPLQIVWSRHGGFYIAGGTHVLLVMLVSYVAGKRRSALLATFGAVCVWATFYNCFAARAAIPLGLAALVAGMQRARTSLGEAARVLGASFATLALIYLWARPPGIMAIVWPVYTGYAGNRGERSLADLISKNAGPVAVELRRTLVRYLLRERAGWEPPSISFHWQGQSRGLCLAAVALVNAALEERHGQPIPFGESGFNEGLTCKRCLYAGYQWQTEIASNRFVVLFENDIERENPTIPGGLPLYGELAVLSAGRPRNFLEFYAVLTNFNHQPADYGAFYDGTRTDFASYLHGRLDAARPQTVIWHFERPTQWERWMIGRLERAGGTVSTFVTPLSASPGVQVRTSWPLSPEVRALLDDLARALRASGRCPGLKQVATRRPGFVPLHLSAGGSTDGAGVPDWLVGSWFKVGFRDWIFDTGLPSGSGVERLDGGGARLHLLLGQVGQAVAFDVPSQSRLPPTPMFARRTGLDCAVRVGPHWWAVDPTT